MKQATAFFALLLTSSLAVGCGGRCDPPETTLLWTFTTASGAQTRSCVEAGVSTLRIFVNDQAQLDVNGNQDLSCAAYDRARGAVIPALARNENVQVEAYDAQGSLLYLSSDTITTVNCGMGTASVNLTAQAGTLVVNLAGFTQCPANSFVWYRLLDVTDPAHPLVYSGIDGLSSASEREAIPCSGAIQFDAVPFGTYRLDFVQVVQRTSDPVNPYGAVYQNCTPQTIPHSADDAVNVTLGPATTVCTAQ